MNDDAEEVEAEALERLGSVLFDLVNHIDRTAGRFDTVAEAKVVEALPAHIRRDPVAVVSTLNDLARKASEVYRYRRSDGTLRWKVRAPWERFDRSVVVTGETKGRP